MSKNKKIKIFNFLLISIFVFLSFGNIVNADTCEGELDTTPCNTCPPDGTNCECQNQKCIKKIKNSEACRANSGECTTKAYCNNNSSLIQTGDLGCKAINNDNDEIACCGMPCSSIGNGAQCTTANECKILAPTPHECSDVCCKEKKSNSSSPCDTCDNPCPNGFKELSGRESECGTTGDLCCVEDDSSDPEDDSDDPDNSTESKKCSSNSPEEGVSSGFLFFKGSLVPCGRQCDDKVTDWDETKTCTICHGFIIFKQFYDLMLSLLITVALALVTIGGLVYILSGGNPGLKTMAKNIITKVLMGFGLFLLSWLLMFTILKFISANSSMLGNGTKWYEFNCDLESKFDQEAEKGSGSSSKDEGNNSPTSDDEENACKKAGGECIKTSATICDKKTAGDAYCEKIKPGSKCLDCPVGP